LHKKVFYGYLSKFVDDANDLGYIVNGVDGTDGEGKLLSCDALGDGELERGPLAVTALAMRRDGIMDNGLDVVSTEVSLEFVAAGR
jgi:hypothetical protein